MTELGLARKDPQQAFNGLSLGRPRAPELCRYTNRIRYVCNSGVCPHMVLRQFVVDTTKDQNSCVEISLMSRARRICCEPQSSTSRLCSHDAHRLSLFSVANLSKNHRLGSCLRGLHHEQGVGKDVGPLICKFGWESDRGVEACQEPL